MMDQWGLRICLAAHAMAFALPASAQTPLSWSVAGSDTKVQRAGGRVLGGQTITPDSSIARPSQAGRRMHTHLRVFIPRQASDQPSSATAMSPNSGLPPYPGYLYETPASLACIYRLAARSTGQCNPNQVTAVGSGGSRAIALVDAYHYATAATDLQTFSSQFGLPAANVQVVFASGSQPTVNYGWATEAALDLQMAHAMAPNATLYLVEAASDGTADLYQAVDMAKSLVLANGGGEISMSFGSAEYDGEAQDDAHFANQANVVFFASTGDNPGTEYPSTSPNVVAVGGTSTSRNIVTGSIRQETAWASGGGGLSAYFSRPSFQDPFVSANQRAVPDVAADADPLTGVWIYCGQGCGTPGWMIVGGTSVASPLMAGMTNAAGAFRASTTAELTYMYSNAQTSAFLTVFFGVCGPYAGYFTQLGPSKGNQVPPYSFCTGIGAPRGTSGL